MASFQNILVGIDFTQCARLSIDDLPITAQDVFRHAVWLARKTGGRLTLMSALDLTAVILDDLSEHHRLALTRTIDADARQVLAELVRQAQEAGVAADAVFVHGKGWLELIRQVLRGRHDLLLVGTRSFSSTSVRRMLLGDTALKLFRRCPCPVWVTRPEPIDRPLNVLVASDLKPASEIGLQVAVALGQAVDVNIHVLHVADYPLFSLCLASLPDEVGPGYERKVRTHDEQALHDQLERIVQAAASSIPVQVHLSNSASRPDEAILQFINEHHIDLLVMGSIGRAGVAGVMIGNTAERLLPEVPCSVLAVKPPDFVCPIDE